MSLDWWASLQNVRSSRLLHPQTVLSFLIQGSNLLCLKPKWSVHGVRASLPTVSDLARMQAGAHLRPSFGAALSLTATSIPYASGAPWGTDQ